MLGIALLALFEVCGVMTVLAVSRKRALTIKIWFGLVVGLMEMMWLPTLYAFAFGFTERAHILSLASAFAVGALLLALSRGKASDPFRDKTARPPIWLMLLLLVPFTLLSARLHYTHSLREIDGALYAGQSTFGDLCMHASFVTGLIGQSSPAEYTMLPGTRLGYPYLVDALSSSMYLYGTPLNLSIVIPGVLMTFLVFWGFLLFSWEVTKSRIASALSLILLVFSGGLGFLYYFDLNGALDPKGLGFGSGRFAAIEAALHNYYNAPANLPDLNLRWVNALCDLLIPQRTLMAGWTCVLPALYMLYTALQRGEKRDFVLLGLYAGPMVMIHTHSFLGLGVISLGALIDALIRGRDRRKQTLINFGLYGTIAVLIALPQLLVWTFPQSLGGDSISFLFNWVNNNGDGTLKDPYLWFWLKNVGPMFLIIPVAVYFNKNARVKALSLGSLMLFLLAEFVVFQPNVYDNNKLFWVAYLCMLPVGCGFLCRFTFGKRHPVARLLTGLVLLVVMTQSGFISILREVNSGETPNSILSLSPVVRYLHKERTGRELEHQLYPYQVFSQSQTAAAEFVKQNTQQDAVFLSDTNHNNAVASLTGRRIVCGAGTYLYYHGVDYQTREEDVKKMLSDPEGNLALFTAYGVDYVYLSSYELTSGASPAVFGKLFPLVYEDEEYWYDPVRIYAVSERARVKFETETANLLQ